MARSFYRKDIDGLRAIAILSVVAYHVRLPGADGGFVGVDVFFVISGFLITSLLANEVRRTGSISFRAFYARRVRRLFPALVAMLLVTCLAGAFVLLPIFDQQQDLGRSAIATALYVSNVHFWLNAPGYFERSAELIPLLHTWSLAVEEQFYLIWPPMIIAVVLLARRSKWRPEQTLMAVAAIILVISLAWCIRTTNDDPDEAFYLLPTRAWELATGALLALWLPRVAQRSTALGTACTTIGIAAILAAVYALDSELPIPGYLVTLPVFGAALVILGGHLAEKNPAQSILSTRPVVFIGLLSYSWYLWHWPMLAFSRAWVMEEYGPGRDVGFALLALLLAYLSYRFIENPIRFGRPGPFKRDGATLVLGAVVSLMLCVPAVTLIISANQAAKRPQYAGLASARDDRPPLRSVCHQEDIPFEKLTPAASCTSGAPGRTPAIYLWGDSHSDHLSPLMQAFAASSPATPTLSRSFPRCPPFAFYDKRNAQDEAACHAFNAAVLAEIRELRAHGLKAVVLSAHWLRVFKAPRVFKIRTTTGAINPGLASPELASSLSETVERLRALGLRVVIVAPLPEMPYDVPDCLARRNSDQCNISRAVIDIQRRDVMRLLEGVQARFQNVRILDLIESVCDTRTCFAARDERILYVDDDHLSASASRSLLPAVRETLLEAVAAN
jgi:peptidoglycan/LPS O-acetylase OafA/YrhL